MNEDPRLYQIAKEITINAGMPWSDPRTGKTYNPPRTKPKHKTKKGKGKCRIN